MCKDLGRALVHARTAQAAEFVERAPSRRVLLKKTLQKTFFRYMPRSIYRMFLFTLQCFAALSDQLQSVRFDDEEGASALDDIEAVMRAVCHDPVTHHILAGEPHPQ